VDRFEQREDDTLPVIERRLQIYAKDTRQLVDYYRPRGIVRDVLIEGGEAVMMPLLKKLIGIR
jgi:adenylate kinase family enzyme